MRIRVRVLALAVFVRLAQRRAILPAASAGQEPPQNLSLNGVLGQARAVGRTL